MFLAKLYVRKHQKDDIVFEYKSKGQEFFIIMKGEVDVLIPKVEKICLVPFCQDSKPTDLDY